MRYFRCEQVDMTQMAAFREKYARLLETERQAAHRKKVWRRLGAAVFMAVTLLCLVGGELLVWSIPDRDFLLLQILQTVLQGLLSLVVVVLSLVLGSVASAPLFSRAEWSRKTEKQAVLAAACQMRREFYGLMEPCLVTKCYASSDRRFTDHDVCLFFVGKELRVTTNLRQGFLRESKDLGCYALPVAELTVCTADHKGVTATALSTEGVSFLLGARAKAFLERKGRMHTGKGTLL